MYVITSALEGSVIFVTIVEPTATNEMMYGGAPPDTFKPKGWQVERSLVTFATIASDDDGLEGRQEESCPAGEDLSQ